MAPTSGGQYHWISEFSPPRFQKYLSYAAGWTSALGWLTGNASGYFILSTLVEALVEVYEYVMVLELFCLFEDSIRPQVMLRQQATPKTLRKS